MRIWAVATVLAISVLAKANPGTRLFNPPELAPVMEISEGFSLQEPNNPGLEHAWNNTLALITNVDKKFTASTATVIGVTTSRSRRYALLLTAKHVLANISRLTPAGAPLGSTTEVARNFRWTFQQNFISKDLIPAEILWSSESSEFEIAAILIEVTDPAVHLEPVLFSPNCPVGQGTPHVIFGFPAVPTRPLNLQKIPIAEADVTTKRWSAGFYTGQDLYFPTLPQLGHLQGSTADALPGMSGGPSLTQNGLILGVQSSVTNPLQYTGHDDSPAKFFSELVGCSETKAYGQRAWAQAQDFIRHRQ
jgi:hypothetical protein